VCASKPWSFSSAFKNLSSQRPLGAEIWSFEKVDLGGSESAHSRPTVLLVHQSPRDFFAQRGRNRCRSHVLPILDISIRSGYVRDRILKWFEVDPNFARFVAPTFLGRAPKNLGSRLYNGRTFRSRGQVSRRSTDETRRPSVKKRKKETSTVKHISSGYCGLGFTSVCGVAFIFYFLFYSYFAFMPLFMLLCPFCLSCTVCTIL